MMKYSVRLKQKYIYIPCICSFDFDCFKEKFEVFKQEISSISADDFSQAETSYLSINNY